MSVDTGDKVNKKKTLSYFVYLNNNKKKKLKFFWPCDFKGPSSRLWLHTSVAASSSALHCWDWFSLCSAVMDAHSAESWRCTLSVEDRNLMHCKSGISRCPLITDTAKLRRSRLDICGCDLVNCLAIKINGFNAQSWWKISEPPKRFHRLYLNVSADRWRCVRAWECVYDTCAVFVCVFHKH